MFKLNLRIFLLNWHCLLPSDRLTSLTGRRPTTTATQELAVMVLAAMKWISGRPTLMPLL